MTMTELTNDDIRAAVRSQYGRIARDASSGCCAPGSCGPGPEASRALGYSADELDSVPEGANLGLGCGNPQALAELRVGETVLDLGAGGGFDCFLAARQVEPTGRVIGVDMTPDMVSRARAHGATLGASNVDFRLGEIEHLPVADDSVDVILSNCVVNLSPDKAAVFRDAFRVLRVGGRLAISDVVALQAWPASLAHGLEDGLEDALAALTSCVSGAVDVATVERLLGEAGFADIRVTVNPESRRFIRDWMPGSNIEDYVASATIQATKPGGSCCAPACCAPSHDGSEEGP
jgi:arsenite methyltransferase